MSMIVESSTDSTLSTSHPNSFITNDFTQLSEIHKKNVRLNARKPDIVRKCSLHTVNLIQFVMRKKIQTRNFVIFKYFFLTSDIEIHDFFG